MRDKEEIVIAALNRDEVDVEIQGTEHPPVGANLTLVRGAVRTEWKVVATRRLEGKVILTCKRVQETIAGPNDE